MSFNIGATQVANIAIAFEDAARRAGKVPDQNELAALSSTVERTLAALTREVEQDDSQRHPAQAGVASPTLIGPADSPAQALHAAIERRELDVEYQPFVHRTGKQVLGFEALARWRRDGMDDVPPSVFVPLAERTGFINTMGEWVLRRACEDARTWPDLALAVNLSP